MKKLLAPLLLLCLALLGHQARAESATCVGKFLNPITDICWPCLFPMSVMGVPIASNPTGLPDNNSIGPQPLCVCTTPVTKLPNPGVPFGFWEPVRLIEVTRAPFCLMSLGGIDLSPGLFVPAHARTSNGTSDGTTASSSFYHAHWFINPVLQYLFAAQLSLICLQLGDGFDIGYLTELDPTWSDDEATVIFNPDAVLFANPISQLVCGVDCVASTIGFPQSWAFWCSGCNGPMYPLNGRVDAHLGAVQASTLVAERMTAKMGRELLMWGADGPSAMKGMCMAYPQIILKKSAYKLQMAYPIPASANPLSGCCQPFGRTTVISGTGSEFPIRGEDFIYQLWRKRDCCLRAPIP